METTGVGSPAKKLSRPTVTIIGSLLVSYAIAALIGYQGAHDPVFAEAKGLDGPDIQALENQNRECERVAETVTPAIANIQTTQMMKVQQSPFFGDPFFRQFFGDMFRGQYNVIGKASDVQAMLADQRVHEGLREVSQ